jgi:hypothetical protein
LKCDKPDKNAREVIIFATDNVIGQMNKLHLFDVKVRTCFFIRPL